MLLSALMKHRPNPVQGFRLGSHFPTSYQNSSAGSSKMSHVVPTGRGLQKVTGYSPASMEKIMLKYTTGGTIFNMCKYSLRSGDPTI